MEIFKDINSLKEWRKAQSGKIGLVPTMGALHQGHLSLIKKCLQQCDTTIVSIFINPLQFNSNLDFKNYPNSIDVDINLLQSENIDALFLPTKEIMYSGTFSTIIEESKVSIGLEGCSRPGHFNGVTTIVAKFFNIVNPTNAFFGEKDAQQLRIIQQMVIDLNYPIEIISCPIIREVNGLAMSSRNKYLTTSERKKASVVFQALQAGKKMISLGEKKVQAIRDKITEIISTETSLTIDYISVSDSQTLIEISGEIERKILVSVAVYLGKVRLIDNFSYSVPSLR